MVDRADTRSLIRRAVRITSADFYAEADMEAAKRLGGILWLIGAAIALLLCTVAPPTEEPVGEWGWIVFAATIIACTLSGVFLLSNPVRVTPNQLLLCSYSALALIGSLVWLGGGTTYTELFLLSVLYTAATHPPRRVAPYLLAMVVVASAPLVYDGWSGAMAGDIVGRVLIWLGLAGVTMILIARIRSQRTGLRRAGDEASRLARIDFLTGLGNRRAFDEALAASMARATRTGAQLTVIVADLDGFKAINDRFGHVAGDACLKDVARALRLSLRAPEACFRWGGDEFSILIDGDRAAGEALSERLAIRVSDECSDPDGNPITMRFGAASLTEHPEATDLVTAADLDLIAAKAA
jgi:diguanylate cyclase (GGDEF)-like protein